MKKLQNQLCHSPRTTAFSLVEVTISLGISAFCLLSILALLPLGLMINQNALEQTTAVGISTSILADLRGAQITTSTSPQYGITLSGTHTLFLTEDGTPSGTQDTNADPAMAPKYRATISFNPPASSSKGATLTRIWLTWPALADKQWGAAPVNYSGSYEIVSALDRN